VIDDVYGFIVAGHRPGDPASCVRDLRRRLSSATIVGAILDSHRRGGIWNRVAAPAGGTR